MNSFSSLERFLEAERGLGIVIVIGGSIGGRRCAFARGSGRGGRMVWKRWRGGRGKALNVYG